LPELIRFAIGEHVAMIALERTAGQGRGRWLAVAAGLLAGVLSVAGCSSSPTRGAANPGAPAVRGNGDETAQGSGSHRYAVAGEFCAIADFSPLHLAADAKILATTHGLDPGPGTEYICQRDTGTDQDPDQDSRIHVGIQADVYNEPAGAQSAYDGQVNAGSLGDLDQYKDPGGPGRKQALLVEAEVSSGSLFMVDGNLYLAVTFSGRVNDFGSRADAEKVLIAMTAGTMRKLEVKG
jgi:hypothetical protein